MTRTEMDTYLGGLSALGGTHHDIGMIWGSRLLSPTGLFANENANVDGIPTSRHMIFLTDGLTHALDIAYSAYGVEGVAQRRWQPGSGVSLSETIEKRFAYVCEDIKKRNITVWVIGFGTSLNGTLQNCAGPGRYFEAANAAELSTAFQSILKNMGDLRISK